MSSFLTIKKLNNLIQKKAKKHTKMPLIILDNNSVKNSVERLKNRKKNSYRLLSSKKSITARKTVKGH